MPTPQQYRAWRAAIRSQVPAASGRGEAAFQWVMAAEQPDALFENFQDSAGFDSLDAKLAAALTSNVSDELGRRVTMAVEIAARHERVLKGRQILGLIHDHRKLDEERGALYDFTDLMSVKLKGDSSLESFWNTW